MAISVGISFRNIYDPEADDVLVNVLSMSKDKYWEMGKPIIYSKSEFDDLDGALLYSNILD